MGVDYAAQLFVGLPREEIPEGVLDRLDKDEIELDQCSPYYDGYDEALIGLTFARSGRYKAAELVYDQAKVDELKAEFKKITGLDAKVWLTPEGY